MRLGIKIALLCAGGVLITAMTLVLLVVWQSGRYNNLAANEMGFLINADLDHITKGVYNLVQTENDAVQSHVEYNLNVARHFLNALGEVSFSNENIVWRAENQFTGEKSDVRLPKLLVGETWLGMNTNSSVETPIVDPTTRLVGDTATVFQRMNAHGDMLRVATNVKDSRGNRAIGTYIPAVNPDGVRNEVIASVLQNQAYLGRAYVVNEWYLAAYEPIRNRESEIIGMLYVGIRQKEVESRIRQAVLQTTVGKTGYVYVLGGKGKDRGKYIISQEGARDGEDIWDIRDVDGRYIIQEIVNKATAFKKNETATVRYRWQNPNDAEPRWKIARVAYYQPWDWVIGTSVYEDELEGYYDVLSNGRYRMVRTMGVAGIVISIFIALICVLIMLRITSPIRQMTRTARKVIDGNWDQHVSVGANDEIGILAHTFNLMTDKLRHTIGDLKMNEEKYRQIYENAIEGLFQSTLDGRFVTANPAMARILGYDSPEALIVEITDISQQVFARSTDREAMAKALLEHGEITGFEVLCRRRDGENVWVSISARLKYTETGEPVLVEGFITNITDRKRAEEALGESQIYFNEIINAFADPMFVKDVAHRWVLVNDALCAFMGRPRSELLGKSDHDYFPKHEADVFWSKDEEVFNTGKENINEETLTDSQGACHRLITKKNLYTDKQGRKFIVAIVRDITAQKTAEEEKKQLELRLIHARKMEAVGTLAGGIAHDFNNILSAIIGFSELARADLHDPESAGAKIDAVLKAGNRAKDLVKQILTFSRMTETSYSPIEVGPVIKESLKMLRSIIPSTIQIRQNINAAGSIFSNPTQIHQIIMNLCTNAAHAMDESGGILDVSLDQAAVENTGDFHGWHLEAGVYLKLSVRDTGKGIADSIITRIFEPYFTTKQHGRGTGLGLSVVHGIVSSHKGAVVCRSVLDEGTTFDVYLPMAVSNRAVSDKPSEVKQLPTGTERILFIDDEPAIAAMAAEMLGNSGYSVVSKTDSVDAVEMFKKAPGEFDLVITDMTMPGLTGDRVARALIEIRDEIPVILCTGYSEHVSEASAKEFGVKAFLFKPLDTKTLVETVRKVLDEGRA